MGSYRVCVCFQRRFKVAEVVPPGDVRELFNKFAEGGAHMSAKQLRRFMAEVQGERCSNVEVKQIVAKVLNKYKKHHHVKKFARHNLTLDDFHNYLFSPDHNPPIRSKIHQDMTAPLSHYYMYTGHNSYLTGNQLSSDCSDVPIIKALHNGVRVVELDIWPNSAKDDILVLHGRTLTTPVEFIKCLKSIKEHAFAASPYPVIITLEDHLTPKLQAKAAQMILETFEDILFQPECENSKTKALPSPEQLKYRILISTKPPKDYHIKTQVTNNKSMKKSANSNDSDAYDTDDPDVSESSDDESSNCGSPESITANYRRLIAIHGGKPKGGLDEALHVEVDKVRRLSLSEQALEKATLSHPNEVVRFTQQNLLRVYPKGTRFNSSNYEPMTGWMHGAQMVAFNMQGYGKHLWVMQGMFRGNGGCGYVKKPEFLMKGQFDPKAELPVKKTLNVKVYLGDGWRMDFKQTHFDSYSPPDFYCRIGIEGVPADEMMKKTEVKTDNWIPDWEEEFSFPLRVPELALLRIEVDEYDMSDSDDFAGQTCLPVSELKQGIRAVPLHGHKGEKYSSVRLLMRFEFV